MATKYPKKQSLNQYLFSRIEFNIAVGLFMEFDHETPLLSDFPEPRDEEELKWVKAQVLKFEQPDDQDIKKDCAVKGDISFPCMKYAKVFKQSPVSIAERLKPYVEWVDFLERIEIKGGYINMFYDRTKFLQTICTLPILPN